MELALAERDRAIADAKEAAAAAVASADRERDRAIAECKEARDRTLAELRALHEEAVGGQRADGEALRAEMEIKIAILEDERRQLAVELEGAKRTYEGTLRHEQKDHDKQVLMPFRPDPQSPEVADP